MRSRSWAEAFFARSVKRQYSEKTSEFYEHSYVIAKYLVDQFGFGRLREMFQKMKSGASSTIAFGDVYQMTFAESAQKAYQN